MPYGVRVKMIGRLSVAFFGTKIFVLSRTPSRVGIITMLESNAAAGLAATSCAASAPRGAAARRTIWARRRVERVIMADSDPVDSFGIQFLPTKLCAGHPRRKELNWGQSR